MALLFVAAAAALVVVIAVVLFARKNAGSLRSSTAAPAPSDQAPTPSALTASLIKLPNLAARDADGDSEVFESMPELDLEVDEESTESSAPRALILVRGTGRTDPGKVRKNNEDSILALPEENLYAVADGIGGQAGGELGSRIAVDEIASCFQRKSFDGRRPVTRYRRANELVYAIELANEAVRKAAAERPEYAEMGTTICAAWFSLGRRRAYIAHAGDSRAYRIRNGEITLLTQDHTLALEAGVKGSMGAQLSRAIGMKRRVRPDVRAVDAHPGDCFLLCSDGLTKMLSDAEICSTVLANEELDQAAQRLIDFANERGGRDNVSVILIRVADARNLSAHQRAASQAS